MKLASLKSGRDGRLVVVDADLKHCAPAGGIAATLQDALDDWARHGPRLRDLAATLEAHQAKETMPFEPAGCASPLPRAYQWCDGSVYPAHMERMCRWRDMPLQEDFTVEPYMYQGASDGFLAPTEDIPAVSEDWGIDYEAEIAIVTHEVPYGVPTASAPAHIALVLLCNDVSLRNLIPSELAKGFGFVQSKPASSFSPVAVTPDELGDAWRNCRLHRPLLSDVNGERFGDPDAGAMAHGFDRLISHAAKTRRLAAGTLIGSGTVASSDPARGTSCIIERRILEILRNGTARTPFLRFGDRVRIEMLDGAGRTIFGAIDQKVVRAAGVTP